MKSKKITLASILAAAALAGLCGCSEKPKETIKPFEIPTVLFEQLDKNPISVENSNIGYSGKITGVKFSQTPQFLDQRAGRTYDGTIIDFMIENEGGQQIPAKTFYETRSDTGYVNLQIRLENLEKNEARVRVAGRYSQGVLTPFWIERNGNIPVNFTDKVPQVEVIRSTGMITDYLYMSPTTENGVTVGDKLLVKLKTPKNEELWIMYRGLKYSEAQAAALINKTVSFTAQRGVFSQYSTFFLDGIKLE